MSREAIERKTLTLEVKTLEETGSFTGLLSVYDVIDEYGDVVERGAYTKTLQMNQGRLPLLWQHNQEFPIGEMEVSDGADGLEVKGRLLLDDNVPQAKTAYALLKAGIVRGLSIGFRVVRKKIDDKVRRLKEIKLYEGSLVTIPANRFALVNEVKSLDIETKDFSSELQMIQLMDGHYQMLSALRSALYKLVRDKDLKSEDKVDAATETLDQFRASYLEFLPQFLSMLEESGDMYYMSADDFEKKFNEAPDELRDRLSEYATKFLAGEKHPGTLQSAARAAEPSQTKTNDPEALQAWFEDLGKRLRSELLASQA